MALLMVYMLFCVLYRLSSGTEEPRCSKFDFEEKVLEKMVRVEHSTSIMMEESRQLKIQIQEKLQGITEEINEIKRKAQEQLEQQKETFDEIINRPSFAFFAVWLSNESPSKGDTLVFSRIIKADNAYNNYTGEYTTPAAGVYIFASTLCLRGDKWASIQYVADKTVLGAYRIGDSSWTLCYSSSVTSYLQKGKKVKIIVFEVNSGAVFYNRENDFLSSFSGHLLK